MVLTRKEKDRIIKVLKEAKPFVRQGFSVCGSVIKACWYSVGARLTWNYIRDLLPYDTHVTQWLCQQHGIRLNEDQAIEYRLAWVDHMIKELRK